MKRKTWVVVANSCQARIFRLEKAKNLVELEILEHPESRLRDHEIAGEKPGRAFESKNPSRHAIEPKTSPHREELIIFAKDLSKYLEKKRALGDFEDLYIAANPVFLGIVMEELSANTKQHLAGKLDKDLTHMKPDEIPNHFPFAF